MRKVLFKIIFAAVFYLFGVYLCQSNMTQFVTNKRNYIVEEKDKIICNPIIEHNAVISDSRKKVNLEVQYDATNTVTCLFVLKDKNNNEYATVTLEPGHTLKTINLTKSLPISVNKLIISYSPKIKVAKDEDKSVKSVEIKIN